MKKYILLNLWLTLLLVGNNLASTQTEFFFFKVVMIGEPQVGKTAILDKFVEGKFEDNYKATIGADFRTKDFLLGEKDIMLQIWDTAGQERFRALAAPFYCEANVVIFVYDITNKQSFEKCQQWLEKFLGIIDINKEDEKIPLIICGNKLDLAEEEKDRQVSIEEVDKFVHSVQKEGEFFSVTSLEVSTKDGGNLQKLFDTVAREALKQKVLLEEKQKKLDEEFKDTDTDEDDDTDTDEDNDINNNTNNKVNNDTNNKSNNDTDTNKDINYSIDNEANNDTDDNVNNDINNNTNNKSNIDIDDTDDKSNNGTNIDENDHTDTKGSNNDTDDKHNNLPNKIKKFFEANTSLCILFLIAIAGGWYLFSSTEQATDYLTDFSQDDYFDSEDEEDRWYNDVVDDFDDEDF